MNHRRRAQLRRLDAKLRDILREIKDIKDEEAADYDSRCPTALFNCTTEKMLDNAKTGLKDCVVWLGRARAAPQFGSTPSDMTRDISV